jgi:hypothetical protein
MAEPDAALHEQYSEMLRVLAASRDERLKAADDSYARALAGGGSAEGLYRDYLAERDAVITKFKLDAVGIGKDYTHRVSASAPPLATGQDPTPAFPPPQPHQVPAAARSGLHSWQTPTPQLAPAAAPARTGKSPRRIVLGIVVVGAILVGITSWATAGNKTSNSGSSSSSYTSTVSSTRTVTYEVVGGATKAGITYSTPSGTAQATVDVPLKTKAGDPVTFEAEPGEFVYISAQNKGKSGNIICRISVDGVVISTNTSSGAYAIASCDGTVR